MRENDRDFNGVILEFENMSLSNNVFKEIESDVDAPETLRKAIVSEIDLMRDSMSVVTLFTSHFFNTVLMAFSSFDKNDTQSPNT